MASSSSSAPGRTPLQARFGVIQHMTTYDGSGGGTGSEPPRSGSGVSIASRGAAGVRSIKTCPSFDELFVMGKEVMPSTHSYMKVNFCTRKEDGLEAVVKVRNKPHCFRSREEERSWRHNTEFLLNVPEVCGVARLHDVWEDPKAFYVVMQKVGGMDLFETFHKGSVGVDAAKDIVRQLLVALVHLHGHNAVHKDLKLENVMLEPIDAGSEPPEETIARNVSHTSGPDATAKSEMGAASQSTTGSGPNSRGAVKVIDFDNLEEWTPGAPVAKDVVGTDQYIPQEAYAGRYSPLSDMFSTGVIAYRLLCGRFPFHDALFDDEPGENWVGGPKMQQIRKRLKAAEVDFSHATFQENPEALDLVTRLLSFDAVARLTAMAALEHPWFREPDAGYSGGWEFAPARCINEGLIDDGIIIAD